MFLFLFILILVLIVLFHIKSYISAFYVVASLLRIIQEPESSYRLSSLNSCCVSLIDLSETSAKQAQKLNMWSQHLQEYCIFFLFFDSNMCNIAIVMFFPWNRGDPPQKTNTTQGARIKPPVSLVLFCQLCHLILRFYIFNAQNAVNLKKRIKKIPLQ